MDSSRLFHLLIISLFSAAVALLGLNELSHRFMKARAKQGEIVESRIVKELSGEVNVVNPLAGRPTERATAHAAPAAPQSADVYGAVREQGQRLMEKLLPKE